MNRKTLLSIFLIFGVLLLVIAEFLIIKTYYCPQQEINTTQIDTNTKPQAMMLLIEFVNTDGLVNMVNDMKQRDIKGILMVNADFVDKNKEAIKEILKTGNIEIAASYDPKPYWEMNYDEQYSIITDMLTRIESALDIEIRIISSRYMASDENTIKIADELGIEYITARGTTELATTVYKPEEYDVKIISVSNIDVPEFKYGSFCDYSFYERAGSPEDMQKEYERAITEEKFIGVSHTYIGGLKARWNEMWHTFWDEYDVDWVGLDELGTIDKTMPMWQIPINKNAPYTPEKIRPEIPYELEENVTNPCQVEDLNEQVSSGDAIQTEKLVMFHNNVGPMCLEALDFFEQEGIDFEQHLTSDADYTSRLQEYLAQYPTSKGVSSDFGFYPIIFVQGYAYSGFNDDIKQEIIELVK